MAFAPLPDWKNSMRADPSRQAWLEKFHLYWVPHVVSIDQKSERMSYSKLLLMALMEQIASDFQHIITGDELWFFFDYRRDSSGRCRLMSFVNA
jgi:hypothetical protein